MASNTYLSESDAGSYLDLDSGSEFVPSSVESEEEVDHDELQLFDSIMPLSPPAKRKVGSAQDRKRENKSEIKRKANPRCDNRQRSTSSQDEFEGIRARQFPVTPVQEASKLHPGHGSSSRPRHYNSRLTSTPVTRVSEDSSGIGHRHRFRQHLDTVRGMAFGLEHDLQESTQNTSLEVRLKNIEKNQTLIMKQLKRMEALLEPEEMNKCANRKMSKSRRLEVPAHIKSAVHDGFRCGHDEKGLNWKTKDDNNKTLKYNSRENKEMTEHVLAFVKGFYPSEEQGIISAAVERYFESVKQREYKKRTGKENQHKNKMMLYSRRKRKLTWRKEALTKKRGYNEEKKKKIIKALSIEFMSSEEEGESDDENCLIVKPLPWRSAELDQILKELDEKTTKIQSSRSKRQALKRVQGTVSSKRARPTDLPEGLHWTLKDTETENVAQENINMGKD